MPRTCINLTAGAPSVLLLQIDGFSATKERSGSMASTMWTAGGHVWRMDFHPRGCDECYHNGWMKLRVCMLTEGSGVVASFSCRLVDPNSKREPSPAITTSSTFYQNRHQDLLVMRRRDLKASGYVKDGRFLVECTTNVDLLGKPKDGAAATGVAPCSDLQKHFGELLRSLKGADITFLVSGESVAAHRCVLAARSPVFMAELFGDMKETALQSIEINDMETEVFKAMLHFIYTDTLPELLDQQGEQATVMAQHLLEAADRYGLERLKGICVEKLCMHLCVDTVATALALAEQHGCLKLKVTCMEFILATPASLHEVAATEGYKHLEASCPSVLTDLLKFMAEKHK